MSASKKPLVERVAGWSARHKVIAVVGWLVFVVLAFTVGQHFGQGNVSSYDPGQAGQAERVMDRPVVKQPPAETVLVQARDARRSYASDADMHQAVAQVVAALRALPGSATDIRSPLTSPGMTSGRSALVTFTVPTRDANDDGTTQVAPAMSAVWYTSIPRPHTRTRPLLRARAIAYHSRED